MSGSVLPLPFITASFPTNDGDVPRSMMLPSSTLSGYKLVESKSQYPTNPSKHVKHLAFVGLDVGACDVKADKCVRNRTMRQMYDSSKKRTLVVGLEEGAFVGSGVVVVVTVDVVVVVVT